MPVEIILQRFNELVNFVTDPPLKSYIPEAIILIFSVVIGAFFTWVLQSVTSRIALKSKAKHLAVQVVSILDDEYISSCSFIIKIDNKEFLEYMLEKNSTFIPKIPTYPENIDWSSINHKLTYRILSLSTKIQLVTDAKNDFIRDLSSNISVEEIDIKWMSKKNKDMIDLFASFLCRTCS